MARDDYLGVFIGESLEQLQQVGDDLLRLEKDPEDCGIINRIFRAMHTLKGGAALDGLESISHLAHRMENIFGQIRDRNVRLDPPDFDTVYASVDVLTGLVNNLHDGNESDTDVRELEARLDALQNRLQPVTAAPPSAC